MDLSWLLLPAMLWSVVGYAALTVWRFERRADRELAEFRTLMRELREAYGLDDPTPEPPHDR